MWQPYFPDSISCYPMHSRHHFFHCPAVHLAVKCRIDSDHNAVLRPIPSSRHVIKWTYCL